MPQDVYALSHRMVDEWAEARPTLATLVGIPGYDHLWDDYSAEGQEALAALIQDQLQRLRRLPDSDDPWARLAARVVIEALESASVRYQPGENLRDLNSIDSPVQLIREMFDHMDTTIAEGWENVAARLEGLPQAVAGYADRLEEGRRRGLTVARRQVLEAVRQCRSHAGEGSPFEALAKAATESESVSADLADRIAAGARAARGGYAALADYLEQEYLPAAVEPDAVGEERYVTLARRFLGEELDPWATYEWGWEEVERLEPPALEARHVLALRDAVLLEELEAQVRAHGFGELDEVKSAESPRATGMAVSLTVLRDGKELKVQVEARDAPIERITGRRPSGRAVDRPRRAGAAGHGPRQVRTDPAGPGVPPVRAGHGRERRRRTAPRRRIG